MPIENKLKTGSFAGCIGHYGLPVPPENCTVCHSVEMCKDLTRKKHRINKKELCTFCNIPMIEYHYMECPKCGLKHPYIKWDKT